MTFSTEVKYSPERTTHHYIDNKEVKEEVYYKKLASFEPTDFQRMRDTLERLGVKFRHVTVDTDEVIFIFSDKPGTCMLFYFDKNNNEKYSQSTVVDISDLHKE